MKIAVITGASSGMGAQFVRQCADKWNGLEEIWILARRQNRLDALKEELQRSEKSTVSIRSFCVDITNFQERETFFTQMKQEQPEVMLLVNSAGVGKQGPFASESCKRETEMIQVNCEALVAMTYGVMPYLQKGSHIIQMASAAAYTPQPNFSVYAATKAFVYSFSRALAQEWKNRGIGITIVCPGPVKTEFLETMKGQSTTKEEKLPWYKQLVLAQASDVVAKAIKDAQRGKMESIYGISMKACKIAGKILPWNLILKFF